MLQAGRRLNDNLPFTGRTQGCLQQTMRSAHTFRWTLRTIRELPAAWTGHAVPDIPSGNSLRRDGADDHRRSIVAKLGIDIERHHSALGRVGGRSCPSSRMYQNGRESCRPLVWPYRRRELPTGATDWRTHHTSNQSQTHNHRRCPSRS